MSFLNYIIQDQYKRYMAEKDLERALAVQRELERLSATSPGTSTLPAPGAPAPVPSAADTASRAPDALPGSPAAPDVDPRINATNLADYATWADLQPFASGPDAAPAANLGYDAAPPAALGSAGASASASDHPASFLEFAQLVHRSGLPIDKYLAAKGARARLQFLASPEFQALPPDQRADAWNKKSAHSNALAGDTLYSRYGALGDASMLSTQLGQSKQALNEARAATEADRANAFRASAALRAAQTGTANARTTKEKALAAKAGVVQKAVPVEIDGQKRTAVLTQMPNGKQAWVVPDQPEGISFLPTITPPKPKASGTTAASATTMSKQLDVASRYAARVHGSDWESLSLAERQVAIEQARRELFPEYYTPSPSPGAPADIETPSAPWSFGGQQYSVGDLLPPINGQSWRVVGRYPDGEPYLERAP